MAVFVDTSAFLAVLNADDRYHQPSLRSWEDLIDSKETLSTSNYILVEVVALLQNKFGMDAVRVFQGDILPIIDIRWVDIELHQRGVAALLAANRRNLSLVDCTSFEMMRQASIQHVFAFDAHFSEVGFLVIPG
jgi:predicted nucleic acid-binding protein